MLYKAILSYSHEKIIKLLTKIRDISRNWQIWDCTFSWQYKTFVNFRKKKREINETLFQVVIYIYKESNTLWVWIPDQDESKSYISSTSLRTIGAVKRKECGEKATQTILLVAPTWYQSWIFLKNGFCNNDNNSWNDVYERNCNYLGLVWLCCVHRVIFKTYLKDWHDKVFSNFIGSLILKLNLFMFRPIILGLSLSFMLIKSNIS